jgi:dTDP-3-amino-3,4,6-trideoxy-alpha-D-glucose transaminase
VTASLPFLDLRPADDDAAIRAALDGVLNRGWFVLGPELEAFETEFAAAAGARFCVGVGNGTDAITLLLRAAGIQHGDEVLVPAMTAAFTALAVIQAGARPVFVDVERDTLLIDVASCEQRLTSRVKAIVPVHLYGQPADMGAVMQFAQHHQLHVVEDCAQAHLATSAGCPVGTFGTGGAFSFYPTKNLAALGDAGAIITNDEAIAATVRMLRNGGQQRRYEHRLPGVNSRLDEVQAAVLRVRLARLADQTARRRAIGAFYRRELAGAIEMIRERDPGHVYHLFPVRSSARDALQAHLQRAGVETLVHYPSALTAQPAFVDSRGDGCPRAEQAAQELASLPLHPRLGDSDCRRIIDAVRTFAPAGPPPANV